MNAYKIVTEDVRFPVKPHFYVMDWNLVTGDINLSSNWLKVLGYDIFSRPTIAWLNSILHPEDLNRIIYKMETKLSFLVDDHSEFSFRMKNNEGAYESFESMGMIVLAGLDGKPAHVIWASQNG